MTTSPICPSAPPFVPTTTPSAAGAWTCASPASSATAGRGVAGTVTVAQCREIAQAKMKDLNANDIEAATKIIMGSARAMGLTVQG